MSQRINYRKRILSYIAAIALIFALCAPAIPPAKAAGTLGFIAPSAVGANEYFSIIVNAENFLPNETIYISCYNYTGTAFYISNTEVAKSGVAGDNGSVSFVFPFQVLSGVESGTYSFVFSANGATGTATVTVSSNKPAKPEIKNSTVAPGGVLNITSYSRFNGEEFEVRSSPYSDLGTAYAAVYSSGSVIDSVTLPNDLPHGTYYLFAHYYDSNSSKRVYSEASDSFLVTYSSKPVKPVVTTAVVTPGGALSIENYSRVNGESFEIRTAPYSDLGTGYAVSGPSESTINYLVMPASLSNGTYYLFAYYYDTFTGKNVYSDVSNSFVVSAASLSRPAVTSGQTVKQGGELKISSYSLPTAEEFVVALTGTSSSRTYYVCSVTANNTVISSVLLPPGLPEGTYNLYVRSKTSTGLVSEASANTFTVDGVLPTISSTTPSANAIGVSPMSSLNITFSETMDTTVGTVVVRGSSGTDPVISKPTWASGYKTVNYTLTGLQPNVTYTVTVYGINSTGITAFRDIAGNTLGSDTQFKFTTGSAATFGDGVSTIPIQGTTTVANSIASTTIDEAYIMMAVDEAMRNESAGYVPTVLLALDLQPTVSAANISVSSTAIYELSRKTVRAGLSINAGHLGTMTFDRAALAAIAATGNGTVTITAERVYGSSMTAPVRAAVGDSPTYNFSVSVGSRAISSFVNGTVSISQQYTMPYAYNADQVVGYRVTPTGSLTPVKGNYKATSGTFRFELGSFSMYTIKYNPRVFSDVGAADWFYQAVSYTSARGLLDNFTTSSILEPKKLVTRAEFLVMFMKAYGIEPNAPANTVQFDDVNPTAYYAEYVRTAKALGLTLGTGNNMFSPDSIVTRETFFTMTYRAIEQLGKIPVIDSGKRVSQYYDADKISSWALAPTEALVRGGIIQGSGNNLNPEKDLSRAELAEAIYKLIAV